MNKKCVTIFCLLLGTFLLPQMTTADEEILSQRWSRIYNGIGDGAWDVAAPNDETVFPSDVSAQIRP